jgi:hypothetical protein
VFAAPLSSAVHATAVSPGSSIGCGVWPSAFSPRRRMRGLMPVLLRIVILKRQTGSPPSHFDIVLDWFGVVARKALAGQRK